MTTIRTILVPVDFSDNSASALDYAVDLAKALDAKLELLHCYQINVGGVSPYGIVLPENFERDCRDAAGQQLARWAEKATAAGVSVGQRLSPLFPSEAIASTAEEMNADLIVMGTRGLTGLKHVLLGSVAERTIRTATGPGRTVRHPELASGRGGQQGGSGAAPQGAAPRGRSPGQSLSSSATRS